MKKKLFNFKLILTFLFVVFLQASNAKSNSSYSLLIEEDYKGAMLIIRNPNGLVDGKMISYGGYKWFKKVFEKKTNNEEVFIQPSGLGISGDMRSWMLPRYQVDDFNFLYNLRGNDAIVTFSSPQSISSIEGYISRNKLFSLSAHQPKVAWFAGTYIPIKGIYQMIDLSKKNPRTFCQILAERELTNFINREISSGNIVNDLQNRGFKCDSFFNLTVTSADKNTDIPSKDKLPKKKKKINYKDYWWVVIILALGTFFLYTLTVKKPKINILKKKKTKQRGRVAKYWAGEDSLAFSFWGVSTIGLTMLQIPNWILLAQGDEIFDTMSDIGALFYLVYLIVFFVAVVIAYVGCWRSAAKYITTKIKKKKSAFWGYTTYVVIVISTVRVFASIITEI